MPKISDDEYVEEFMTVVDKQATIMEKELEEYRQLIDAATTRMRVAINEFHIKHCEHPEDPQCGVEFARNFIEIMDIRLATGTEEWQKMIPVAAKEENRGDKRVHLRIVQNGS